jgi:hypothetical protein
MEPAEFFHLAYPKRTGPDSRAATQLREALQHLQLPPEEKRPEPFTEEQLEKMMMATLRKLMGKEAEGEKG